MALQLAAIEFTDPRYAGRFKRVPPAAPVPRARGDDPGGITPPPPAKIVIPGVVTERDYDLVCIGSPPWWLSTDVPVRSFLQSDTASRDLKGKPFAAAAAAAGTGSTNPTRKIPAAAALTGEVSRHVFLNLTLM